MLGCLTIKFDYSVCSCIGFPVSIVTRIDLINERMMKNVRESLFRLVICPVIFYRIDLLCNLSRDQFKVHTDKKLQRTPKTYGMGKFMSMPNRSGTSYGNTNNISSSSHPLKAEVL